MNNFSLDKKTILVFGATGGIGEQICKSIVECGGVPIAGGRDLDKLNLLNSEFSKKSEPFFLESASEDIIEEGVKKLPKIDGFVFAAGINKLTTVRSLNIHKFEETLRVNTILPAVITKHLIKAKKLNNGASIVYISSIAGIHRSSIGNSTYSASKAALDGFMKNAALELSGMRIRVNCVNPAMIRTNLLGKNGIGEEEYQKDEATYPLGRYGLPEDVANSVIFLLSSASSWITGQNLILDGGVTLR